jgi:DNA processing protein
MEERDYWLALNRIPIVGAQRFHAIYEYFGSIKNFWEASSSEFKNFPGITQNICNTILEYREKIDVSGQRAVLKKIGAEVVFLLDENYPDLLRNIYDPPPVLYYKGEFEKANCTCVAVVGSRKATSYGRRVAEELAEALAKEGITIVSGLAYGIDTHAHYGALKAGKTIAVLGTGIDIIYPKSNFKLSSMIQEKGAIITEFPPGTQPLPPHFPIRNRIISGLCLGTIVVEAAEKSGSLITADLAADQGREVFAVPGNVNSSYSIGPNRLIKQGARLVENYTDVLIELGIAPKQKHENKNTATTLEENCVLRAISYEPTNTDYIIAKSGLPPALVNSLLTSLEIKGLIRIVPGGCFIRI